MPLQKDLMTHFKYNDVQVVMILTNVLTNMGNAGGRLILVRSPMLEKEEVLLINQDYILSS